MDSWVADIGDAEILQRVNISKFEKFLPDNI